MEKDKLEKHFETIEGELGSQATPPSDVEDKLEWHLETIEDLIEGGLGTEVEANPEMSGSEPSLTSIKIGESKYTLSSAQPAVDYLVNPMTTPGDIIITDSEGIPDRLGKGTEGQVLTAGQDGIGWATPAGGGTKLYKHTLNLKFEMGSSGQQTYTVLAFMTTNTVLGRDDFTGTSYRTLNQNGNLVSLIVMYADEWRWKKDNYGNTKLYIKDSKWDKENDDWHEIAFSQTFTDTVTEL